MLLQGTTRAGTWFNMSLETFFGRFGCGLQGLSDSCLSRHADVTGARKIPSRASGLNRLIQLPCSEKNRETDGAIPTVNPHS